MIQKIINHFRVLREARIKQEIADRNRQACIEALANEHNWTLQKARVQFEILEGRLDEVWKWD